MTNEKKKTTDCFEVKRIKEDCASRFGPDGRYYASAGQGGRYGEASKVRVRWRACGVLHRT